MTTGFLVRGIGRLGLAVVCAMAAGGCARPSQTSDATPTPPPPNQPGRTAADAELHHGIDVSSHSGVVDWTTVRSAGHSFAFIKASEGLDLPDPDFAANWEAAKAAGLIRGAYHFFVTEDDPEAQARLFTETVDLAPGDLAPVIDIELIGHGTTTGLPDRLRRFAEALEDHYGVRPIIYTSPNFWNAHFDDGFGGYPLWIAEYGVDEPTLPLGWDRWHLWQWQENATISGVEHGADLSRVNRSLDDLHRLIVPEP